MASIINHGLNLRISLVIELETVGDILTDGAGEEHGLLLNDSDLLMQPFRIKISDVVSVEEYFTLLRVIEPLNERNDAGLAASRGATKGNNSVDIVVYLKGDSLEDLNIGTARVPELYIFEFESTVDLALDLVTSAAVDSGFVIHQLDNLVRGADDSCHVAEDVRDHAKGEHKLAKIEQEGSNGTDGKLAGEVEFD